MDWFILLSWLFILIHNSHQFCRSEEFMLRLGTLTIKAVILYAFCFVYHLATEKFGIGVRKISLLPSPYNSYESSKRNMFLVVWSSVSYLTGRSYSWFLQFLGTQSFDVPVCCNWECHLCSEVSYQFILSSLF